MELTSGADDDGYRRLVLVRTFGETLIATLAGGAGFIVVALVNLLFSQDSLVRVASVVALLLLLPVSFVSHERYRRDPISFGAAGLRFRRKPIPWDDVLSIEDERQPSGERVVLQVRRGRTSRQLVLPYPPLRTGRNRPDRLRASMLADEMRADWRASSERRFRGRPV